MERGKAIKLLKQALTEVPHLKELHHGNQECKLWHDKVLDIIKAGLDADDVSRFLASMVIHVVGHWTSDDVYQEHYLEKLENCETALKSIIQKYEITGMDTIQSQLPEDTTELANLLFDKMQFHPKVIEASKSLFETQHYAQAILEAFKAVNNFAKQRTGLDLDGKRLMTRVFDERDPIIRLNEGGTQSQKDEREGFKFLFMGAMVGIRNPKAHDDIAQMDSFRTLEYLGFASLLMKRIEEGEVTQVQGENV